MDGLVTKDDNDILAEFHSRFQHCQDWESSARTHWLDDYRFGHADAYNLYAWENGMVDARGNAGKPCFTVNRTEKYCNVIVNEARQNRASIKIRPIGSGSTFKSAEILQGICSHVEYQSNAQAAYMHAVEEQVFSGIGYWRVTTDYAHDASFDQEVFIRPLDALAVFLDPDIEQFDGSDANFGFVFTTMDRKAFDKAFPKFKGMTGGPPGGIQPESLDWQNRNHKDTVIISEYYRRIMETDTLHALQDGGTIRESKAKEVGLLDKLESQSVAQREIEVPRVEWFKIVGSKIVERTDWPGRYIPIVRCVGTETTIDGILDRAGHTRSLLDPQKAYNYYTSAGVEYVALQTKSPWIAPAAAMEGYETYYKNSNTSNTSVIPYKHKDSDGETLAPPQRSEPPVYAGAFLDGMKVAIQEMEMASGQTEAAMGETSQERSGVAVRERTRNSLTSTYHFSAHFADAIRFTGRILIDLIPKVYDSERVLKIMMPDGTPQTIKVDPNAPAAHTPVQALDPESIDPQQVAAIYNPNLGEYDCIAESGPQFTTLKQEAVSALGDILAQNEALSPYVADLMFKNMDFPGSQEIAQRLRRIVPPQALGIVDPQVQELQKLLSQQHQLMLAQSQTIEQLKNKQDLELLQKQIDQYKAESERMKVVGAIDPESLKPIIRQLVSEALGTPINPLIHAHALEAAQTAAAAQAINPGAEQPTGQPQTP